MTGQNDRQDRSLTGQVQDQAGHCPLTGRYFQPCRPSEGSPRPRVNFFVKFNLTLKFHLSGQEAFFVGSPSLIWKTAL